MDLRYSVITCINSRERTTKKHLTSLLAIKNDTIQETIKWFNILFDKNILYDKSGYYITSKLEDKDIEILESINAPKIKTNVIYYLLLESLHTKKKIPKVIKKDDSIFLKKTLNTFLSYIKLPDIDELVSYSIEKKIYYLSIMPQYFTSSDENDIYELLDKSLCFFNIQDKSRMNIQDKMHSEIESISCTFENNIISYHTYNCLKILYVISYIISDEVNCQVFSRQKILRCI